MFETFRQNGDNLTPCPTMPHIGKEPFIRQLISKALSTLGRLGIRRVAFLLREVDEPAGGLRAAGAAHYVIGGASRGVRGPASMRIPASPGRCHGGWFNTPIEPHILMLMAISNGTIPMSFWWDRNSSSGVGVVVVAVLTSHYLWVKSEKELYDVNIQWYKEGIFPIANWVVISAIGRVTQ